MLPYVYRWAPDHPNAMASGKILEHVFIAAAALGKPLPRGTEVHHLDNDGHNNDPSNLVVCQDRGYHFLLHARMRALEACGNANWRKCAYCKQYDDTANMVTRRRQGNRSPGYAHATCLAQHFVERRKARSPAQRAKDRAKNRAAYLAARDASNSRGERQPNCCRHCGERGHNRMTCPQEGPPTWRPKRKGRKTHCKNGHEFNERNTYVNPRYPTYRICKPCQAQKQKRRRARVHGYGNPTAMAKMGRTA
jgi:hypothetical protein